MQTGAFTGYFDVAQVVLYIFWIFFAGLVFYLRREDKRDGYPLESDRSGGRIRVQGFPSIPAPKTMVLTDGSLFYSPHPDVDNRQLMARPTNSALGSPLTPIGNPMLAAVGPGSYAQRSNHPDIMLDGLPLIVPLRRAAGFSVASEDPDPRGMGVYGADRERAGTVTEVWVDRAEPQIRYLELEIPGGRRVMLPIHFSKFDVRRGRVNVQAILSTQFADVPALANPDQITLLEEDKITAYYGGGKLYATAARSEPFI